MYVLGFTERCTISSCALGEGCACVGGGVVDDDASSASFI